MERKKLTPDKWEFTYNVTKRRPGNAPGGSGVPVGTEYHWYILANQNVKKLDANSYTTSMLGLSAQTKIIGANRIVLNAKDW